MVKMSVVYQGQKHCELTHEQSGTVIETDAPKDNQGKGERFSPTDLMGAALGSCILTTMALNAENESLSLEGSTATVEKVMTPPPRRVASLAVRVTMPARLTSEQRAKLENFGRNCPVIRSLHPEVQLPISFEYK